MTKERSRILLEKSQHEDGAILFSIQEEGQRCRSVVRLICQTTKPITRRDALVHVSHSDSPTVRLHGPSSDQRCLRIRIRELKTRPRVRAILSLSAFSSICLPLCCSPVAPAR